MVTVKAEATSQNDAVLRFCKGKTPTESAAAAAATLWAFSLTIGKIMDSLEPNSEEDIFHSVVCVEQGHYKEGYNQGYAEGLASINDQEDGRQVGLRNGFEVGEELGFYRGVVDVWGSSIMVDPNCFSSRFIKIIKQMEDLINKYPISNPEDESVTDLKNSLRLKFRAICASLHLKLEYNGYPKPSSDDGNIEF